MDLRQIESWTPVDSLAWLKAMAWDLKGNYDEELGRARAYAAVSYTHLRAHETVLDLVCRLLLDKKQQHTTHTHTQPSI